MEWKEAVCSRVFGYGHGDVNVIGAHWLRRLSMSPGRAYRLWHGAMLLGPRTRPKKRGQSKSLHGACRDGTCGNAARAWLPRPGEPGYPRRGTLYAPVSMRTAPACGSNSRKARTV